MVNVSVDYLSWLMNIIEDEHHKNYKELCRYLFSIEFIWSVSGDENRSEDGKNLRSVYCDQTGQNYIYDSNPCSVLEMMIALAVRGSEDILWDGRNNYTSFLFWTMIDNLGLIDCVDGAFDIGYAIERIDIFLKRNYDKNGFGGLFRPSHFYFRVPKKWEKMEIWYQMQNWINDNFL